MYGIVRQSGASIKVYSKPGRGSSFVIHFPLATDQELEDAIPGAISHGGEGSETVLLVEDEGQLRSLLRRHLKSLGYAVLDACDGQEALEIAALHDGPIHLLLTDVVMPRLSGKLLAERITAQRPGVKVLFISGYSDDAIATHGVLKPGSTLIQKPVQLDFLARAVRETLDERQLAQAV